MGDDGEKDTLKKFNELMSSVVELIVIAERIKNAMHEKIKVTKTKKHIFLYHFLDRTVRTSASVVLVSKCKIVDTEGDFVFESKGSHFDEAAILARSALEGMFGFRAYMDDNSLADKWYLYTIYEGYRRKLRIKKLELKNKKDAEAAAVNNLVSGAATSSLNLECSSLRYPKLSSNRLMSLPSAVSSTCRRSTSACRRLNSLIFTAKILELLLCAL